MTNAYALLRRPHGFTLIEILVVIVILGILAALIVPRVMDRPDQARATAARADIATIMQALKLYKLDNGMYPSSDQGLAARSTCFPSAPIASPAAKAWTPTSGRGSDDAGAPPRRLHADRGAGGGRDRRRRGRPGRRAAHAGPGRSRQGGK